MFATLDPRKARPGARIVRRRLPASLKPESLLRRGVTLVELLVVVAILVILAALASIPLATVLQSQALSQGADILRARLAQTRVEAMRTGKIHLLEYSPDTNQFGIAVWEGEILEGETMSPDGLVEGSPRKIYLGSGSLEVDGQAKFGAATEFLPDGVRFVGGQTLADERTLSAAEDSGTGTPSSSAQGAAPVYFYPDGTTSKSSIVLANENGNALVVTLRGLTGFTTVTETTLGGAP